LAESCQLRDQPSASPTEPGDEASQAIVRLNPALRCRDEGVEVRDAAGRAGGEA